MKKILFFIKGSCPTEAEREASEIVGNVVFRNASIKCEFPESCDGVAGCAPENYKALFPFVGTEAVDSSDVDDVEKPKAKPGRKPKAEPKPIQTPLIPAENSWTPNA